MKILSLFDGISCGQVAIKKLLGDEKKYEYFSSEVKKYAMNVTRFHFPNTIFLGDVCKIKYDFEKKILFSEKGIYKREFDLLIGGSPCQNFSIAGDKKGLEGEKSKLFFEYLRILKEVRPKYFLLENVKMKKEEQDKISRYLNVEPIFINSRLVSFQNRPRLYWTNIENITLPLDKKISFQDFKETNLEQQRRAKLPKCKSYIKMWNDGKGKTNTNDKACTNITYREKVNTVMRKQEKFPNSGLVQFEDFCRTLTIGEQEMAQTLPYGYTKILSKAKAQDVIGDGFTVDVIVHILSFIPEFQKGTQLN